MFSISGVSTTNTNFNGTFSGITVIDARTFAWPQSAANDSRHRRHHFRLRSVTVSYSTGFLQFGVSQTIQGIAINPISRAAVMADPNSNLLKLLS